MTRGNQTRWLPTSTFFSAANNSRSARWTWIVETDDEEFHYHGLPPPAVEYLSPAVGTFAARPVCGRYRDSFSVPPDGYLLMIAGRADDAWLTRISDCPPNPKSAETERREEARAK